MGVFRSLFRKAMYAYVGKEYVATVRAIVDEVNSNEHIQLIDGLCEKMASHEIDGDTAISALILFPSDQFGGRIEALVQSLPKGKPDNWKETLLAMSKLRGELGALIVDAVVNAAIRELPTESEQSKALVSAREELVANYRKGEPVKFVQEALHRG